MPRGWDLGQNRGDLSVGIDSSELARLAADLKQAQPELVKEMRKAIRARGQILLGRVKANAAWSSRIPAATTMRTSFVGKTAGVKVSTDRNKAPHARPLERGSQGSRVQGRELKRRKDKTKGLVVGRGYNRHPVFGNREVWVNQPLRPYMLKAADEPFRAQTQAEVAEAIDRVAKKAGFR